jgi:hypothetical protein
MKEEYFDCKFPQISIVSRKRAWEVGTQGLGEEARSQFLMGGGSLACGRGELLSASLFNRVAWGLSGAYKRMVLPNN